MFEEITKRLTSIAGTCTHCLQPFDRNPHGDYMLTKAAWETVHPEGRKGFLHESCLVTRAQNAGLTLGPEAFTSCLCYVNRHIHLPQPDDVMGYLVNYFREKVPGASARKRPHFGFVVSNTLQRLAETDLWMAQLHIAPSQFSHLFRSQPMELGTEFLEP